MMLGLRHKLYCSINKHAKNDRHNCSDVHFVVGKYDFRATGFLSVEIKGVVGLRAHRLGTGIEPTVSRVCNDCSITL